MEGTLLVSSVNWGHHPLSELQLLATPLHPGQMTLGDAATLSSCFLWGMCPGGWAHGNPVVPLSGTTAGTTNK
jgi:hypothetical protein